MEFLAVIEQLKASEASSKRLFEGEGKRARAPFRESNPEYKRLLVEAAELVQAVFSGKKHGRYLMEAMTTSDFPVLFGDILDRQILANYQNVPSNWQQFVKRRTTRDFRTIEYRYWADGAGSAGTRLERVHEQEEYPEASLPDMSSIKYSIGKYGRRIPFSWEALINDDVDLFEQIPEKFGVAAARTEARTAIELFVASTGPVSPFFSVGNGNLLTGAGSALSISSLQSALRVFADLRDDDGEPILVEAAILVVPPSLEVIAQNIVNATEIEMTQVAVGEGDLGTAGQARVRTGNWLRNRVRVVVEPYLPVVNTTNGETAWFLFADPDAGRPAGEMAFLRGHENPEVFIKSPNAQRVGGGDASPFDGDFDTDSIEYKVRHVLGATRVEPKAAVASEGQ